MYASLMRVNRSVVQIRNPSYGMWDYLLFYFFVSYGNLSMLHVMVIFKITKLRDRLEADHCNHSNLYERRAPQLILL
jgi:hypothetical protein